MRDYIPLPADPGCDISPAGAIRVVSSALECVGFELALKVDIEVH